jgi:hypothetical protein
VAQRPARRRCVRLVNGRAHEFAFDRPVRGRGAAFSPASCQWWDYRPPGYGPVWWKVDAVPPLSAARIWMNSLPGSLCSGSA